MLKLNVEDCKSTLRETDFPTVVIIETSSFCNLECIMCPQKYIVRKGKYIEQHLYRKIIEEIMRENKDTEIWFAIMGEPLIKGLEFANMVRYAYDLGLKNLNLNTNAAFLDKQMVDALLKCGLVKITIGIDATNANTYSKIRKNGIYSEVVKNVEYLLEQIEYKKSCLEVVTQFIAMDENEGEIDEFKEFWLKRGATVKVRPKLGWGGESGISTENLYLEKKDRTFPCPWLIRTMSIHVDGNVAQCDADWDDKYNLANVNEYTLKYIWNNQLKVIRDRHWNLDFTHKPCSECKDWQAGRSYFYYPKKKEVED